ncbi:nucleoside/nucleotide kinase family protein [Pseudonocardia spinosispora]|uniref:nucleoside/nucleotide kinase family protein n=1 Tax=Pseudonocardia spinosispora TaxID=103441 RepID=UPI00041D8A99|nr:nucleoside/nucleotide kinase family protein [Pseudonocardia spinosispora]
MSPLAEEHVTRACRLAGRGRALLGIAGQPGGGKSTFAEALLAEVNAKGVRAALVGMDGFHIADRSLRELGLREVKGAPETFDAAGYVAMLRRLRDPAEQLVWAPEFRREIEDAIQSAVPVPSEVELVITEGNYLLLDGPWGSVRDLCDEVWFVDVDDDLRKRRLAARHEFYGRTPEEAWERTLGSDERNARTVAETRLRADLVVTMSDIG